MIHLVHEDLWDLDFVAESCDRAKQTGPCPYGENFGVSFCGGHETDCAYLTTHRDQVTCEACKGRLSSTPYPVITE